MKTIWCLFSVVCDYNQPDYNLEAWFSEKPTFEQLSKVFKYKDDLVEDLLKHCSLKKVSGCNYYLKEVKEGIKL